MALGGSYNTYNVNAYTDALAFELQQKQSLLRSVVEVEKVQGERTYFDKLGATDDAYLRTARLEDIQISSDSMERRFVTPSRIEKVHVPLDDMQRDRWARDISPEVVQSMMMTLNRKQDSIISVALDATAARELDGAISNAAFDANFNIAVNNNTNSAYVGDTGLHEGKLIEAKTLLLQAHNDPNEIPIVVANARTLAGLASRKFAALNGNTGGYMAQLPNVDAFPFDRGLDGFLGMRYLSYEGFAVDANADNVAFVIAPGAIKLGIWQDVQVKEGMLTTKAGFPTAILANMSVGAVRMFEEKIVRIKCDPNNTFATV